MDWVIARRLLSGIGTGPHWLRSLVAALVLVMCWMAPPAPVVGQGGEDGLPEVSGWSLSAPLPVPTSEQTVVVLGGKIYIAGGYAHARIPVDHLWIYDPATNRCSAGPPLPLALHHAPGATVNGKLYILGGEAGGAGTGLPSLYLNSVFELDPQIGEWVARASMPTSRSAGGAAVIDGKIYVAGGRTVQTGADFAVYDPATDVWTALPSMPTQRNHLAVAAIDGLIYVAGGRFGGGFNTERTAALEVYNPGTQTWTTRASMLGPRGGVARGRGERMPLRDRRRGQLFGPARAVGRERGLRSPHGHLDPPLLDAHPHSWPGGCRLCERAYPPSGWLGNAGHS